MNGNQYVRHAMSFAVGDRWRFSRRSVSAAFTASKMRLMMYGMTKAVDRFLNLLEARCLKAPDGEANIYPLIGSLTFDVVAETACGLYLDVQHKPNDQYFDSARSFMLNIVESAYQRIGQFFSEVKSILAMTCMLELQFGCEPLTALSRKSEPIVVLREKDQSSLLDAKVPKELLRWREFRERTDDQGEFETVSASGSICAFCLAKYPGVQERVRQEVNAVYEKYGGFTYDAVRDLTYTRQTVDESLRLYPPVVAFSPEKKAARHPLAFQPFGLGARNCVGMRMAQIETILIAAMLVHRFRLHLGSRHANGELERKTESIIASPKNGVWIRAEKI
ncbi:hypothetical protein HPB52_008561 [Rhipicephalus sanguineus]|uniref:Cytochrome P450 n=1 Tax=Rhipicephalus sanguineus TaxID=34632 RepID=A0A9D4SRU6_RHISA|nr:hypothetical protein HPB52_008561 [Rhipicephalus sanguineus]